jgi:hypothetical protein
MLFLAKAVLGLSATLAMSAVYVFHEGVIKIDVDEYRGGGSHVHVWAPATTVNIAMYVVPRRHLEKAAARVQPYLPALRELAKELKKYPNAQLVDVKDANEHVQVALVDGRIQIDVVDPEEDIHVRVPLETLEDVSDRLEANSPTI